MGYRRHLEQIGHTVAETEPMLMGEEDGKSLVMLSRTCNLHTLIQQVPLLEPRRQKFSIGFGETKLFDQVIEVFLAGVVWGSVLSYLLSTVQCLPHSLTCCSLLKTAAVCPEEWVREAQGSVAPEQWMKEGLDM